MTEESIRLRRQLGTTAGRLLNRKPAIKFFARPDPEPKPVVAATESYRSDNPA
jgi:hypothetical protein